VAEAAQAPDQANVTSAVTTSFAFGWQMARLYSGPLSAIAKPGLDDDLPGLSELPAAQQVTLGLAQADKALSRLKAFLGDDAQLPTTEAVRAETEKPFPDANAIRIAIFDLHVAILLQLTAADYRLGKAYGLGRVLADTCAPVQGFETGRRQALVHHLEPHRAQVIVGWLDDLKTVLPAHASEAVADSLLLWERWAGAADLPNASPAVVNSTTRALHRCGQRWRAVLSGEKAATDVLEISDYVNAARGTVAQAGAIAWSLARRLWAPLAAALALIGVGIWLIIANHSNAQVLAGLGTIAGGLGITWRSASGSLKHLSLDSLDLFKPLWGAQIDQVVAARLTPAEQLDYRPPSEQPADPWRRAWQSLERRIPWRRPAAQPGQAPDQRQPAD
jgi:hypothetical protein